MTPEGRTPISYFHPRVNMGRINGYDEARRNGTLPEA